MRQSAVASLPFGQARCAADLRPVYARHIAEKTPLGFIGGIPPLVEF